MKALMLVAVAMLAGAAGGAETKLGAGVTLPEATPIKALLERPQDYAGKTVRIDGVATAVCQMMGCWMAVRAEDDEKGGTVRLKVEDGVIVFPITAKGRRVSAQGVFEEIGAKDSHGQEAAGEHAKHDAGAVKQYHIAATGALVR
jgi:hypothetical protein